MNRINVLFFASVFVLFSCNTTVTEHTNQLTEIIQTVDSISKGVVAEDLKYVELSDVRFEEIQKMYNEQECDPIEIKGVDRSELISFYIKSYGDETISTYTEWAYKKMNNFEQSIPSPEQDAEFKKIMELPKTRENTFRFMALMNDEQFRTVGY